MISYAGVPLPLVTSELGAWLQAHLDVGENEWFNTLDANTPELNCSTRTRERSQPAMRLSTLIWPTDLSRFATALYVCTTQQLNQILAIVDAGKPRVPAALRIGAGINTQMVLLSPVQVSGRPVDPASLSNAVQQGPPGVSQYEGLWLLHTFISATISAPLPTTKVPWDSIRPSQRPRIFKDSPKRNTPRKTVSGPSTVLKSCTLGADGLGFICGSS